MQGVNGTEKQELKRINMCLYPKLIKNRKYTATKKNGGNIPAISDDRVKMVPVGCGKCMECMMKKKREWMVRLYEEVKERKDGKFVTLTFSDEQISKLIKEIKGLNGYELDNEIATVATRRFLERWRKKYKKSVRHWLITELGHNGTENIHIHGIIWTEQSMEEIERIWQYGWVWKGKKSSSGIIENYVSTKTINYITKYVQKVDQMHKEYKPKILCSNGIGKRYTESHEAQLNKYKGEDTRQYYYNEQGKKMGLTIYWRNKIYTEEEREKLWLGMLDKNERFICGEKIKIDKGEEEYYNTLEWYRAKNDRLGYGNDNVNWERKKYEQERRNIKTQERLKKANARELPACYATPENEQRVFSEAMKPSKQW